ncbi:hypothetical protein COU88_01245 [Candidatus Roizmanbacteria bacterium CG10_big_fil_rev_8_21_14_0_10_39_6]|uniref:Uncharacterized protein n=1 Tax=Candidatus Roizmanbacteria bacterium CG10_big_fil_rev_8_21_14_0_10_39_6 TaxID=1974853 RepID=A0A2M8KTB7_9BACT|nr:MAG: hypothetical protein COU88_01245 [Candidatus Roizmanbacteria bacterium CG10_big_fil_rev_8_21_14_0_10_39_6]
MKIYLLIISTVVALTATISAYFLFNDPSFHVEATSENSVDVVDINVSDYKFVSEGGQNKVLFTKKNIEKQVFYDEKPLTSIALSPSQSKVGFFYRPNVKITEEASLIIFDMQERTLQEVYRTTFASWDVTGKIHWLSDDYIFFLRHCGTACQGITLLSLESGKTIHAVLSYPSFSSQSKKTHFKDWFGKKFIMIGLVEDIKSTTENNLNYLVFAMKDYEGNSLGQKRFLFTGSALEEVE